MNGWSNMRSDLYCIEMGTIADQSILWFVAFNVLVAAPSPICHLFLISYGLTPECLSLDVKVLWEDTSWHQTPKTSSSRSLIIFAYGTLASSILAYETSYVAIKDGLCTVSRIPVPILVPWTLLCNASTIITAIPTTKYYSSLLCDNFGKRTEWGYQSCWYVRTIQGQYSNCFCVGDEVSAQTIVPDI